MYSFDKLYYDLNELIYFHLNASIIQIYVRKWFYRHTKHEKWNILRHKLLKTVKIQDFKRLEKNRMIRREWCQEPQSWIHTLHFDKKTIIYILQELELGLWN